MLVPQRSSPGFGLATDPQGTLYAAVDDENAIRRVAASGHALASPNGIDVDLAGNVYVADRDNHRVVKFDAAGGFVSAWGYGVAGSSAWQICTSNCAAGVQAAATDEVQSHTAPFYEPSDVTVMPDGSVLVADVRWVRRFSADGTLLGSVGSRAFGTISARPTCGRRRSRATPGAGSTSATPGRTAG